MKAYKNYNKQDIQLLAILLFILVFIAGCASTKYIEDHQAIVKKVEIDSIDKAYKEAAYLYVQKDIKPIEGFGIGVGIYNIFNTKDGKYRKTNIKPLGNPPPILDSTLVEISRAQIEKFLKSKGFFNAEVKSDIQVRKKKAKLTFTAKTGKPFMVNELTNDIADEAVKSLYLSSKDKFSRLHVGMQYDEDSLSYEREEIYQLMRKNGYYDFVRPYVKFSPDSNQNNNKVKVKLIIDNPIDSTDKHKVYTIGETNIIIAPNTDGFTDSITLNKRIFNRIRFTDLSGKFRRNPITRYDFIRPGERYNIENEQLTYDRLYQLNIFKNVKIDYLKNKDTASVIDPVILLTPQKRMSNRIEGEIPFNNATVGFTLSNTYIDNNFLKGGEKFQFQVKGGLQSRFSNIGSVFSDIYQRDFSVGASLTVPRLMVPFRIPIMGKNGIPYTTFSSSYLYALQKDITIRRIFINSITYDWVETKSKMHSFTPLNFEYRFGSVLMDILDENNEQAVLNNFFNLLLLDRKNVTLGMKYAYSLNADKLLQNTSFIYFRGNIDIAGNLLQGISSLTGKKHSAANGNEGKILGLPYNQYVRPEIDIRWYKSLGAESQLVTRINGGIGHAYGNSVAIPYEKMFYAGGSSGVRAWQARTLGPGNYNRATISTQEARAAAFGFDQIGQMRIEANLEYRFPLARRFFGGKLNGATFLDAGNIWNIGSSSSTQTETYFRFDKLGEQIALGTGLGFRYDVQFFVFRFDVGLKLKDPQFVGDEQWVIGKFINGGKAFKANYLTTHSPDRYRFLQYNFGIGMPF
ncbi:BamA/TamA family outer membrane protein [Pedobacter xixiisoli]|uniref:Outer membrane protein assembly factor BamA n=1 Tax=Pedobacter xixiisoli TaxID=1476464 RepID=A0A285ZYL5_9SPHI|nr:BamA/TamA family outer membrane protein [Pedobacter xixiisoli]SOD14733.1 Outer membrane protein assembly factor BamA [Pedobacter xixiisoli]